MVAVDETYDISHLRVLEKINIDIIEADVLPDDKKEKIHLSDLMRYGRLVENIKKPVVVPTQRIIEPDEVKYLYDLGVKGIMIGAIVTGNEVDDVKRVTEKFRNEIDKL
jgi:putative N-acetylmannosamine-6-phosphate epimerase